MLEALKWLIQIQIIFNWDNKEQLYLSIFSWDKNECDIKRRERIKNPWNLMATSIFFWCRGQKHKQSTNQQTNEQRTSLSYL